MAAATAAVTATVMCIVFVGRVNRAQASDRQVRNESHKINKFDKNQLKRVRFVCHLFASDCRRYRHCCCTRALFSIRNSTGLTHCFERYKGKAIAAANDEVVPMKCKDEASVSAHRMTIWIRFNVRRTIDTDR